MENRNTMRDVEFKTLPQDPMQLRVIALGAKSAGGANNAYMVQGFDSKKNDQYTMNTMGTATTLYFQNGPIKDGMPNGMSMEAVATVLIDRLKGLQQGPYACTENQEALDAFEFALSALQRRSYRLLVEGSAAPTPPWNVEPEVRSTGDEVLLGTNTILHPFNKDNLTNT